MAIVFFGWSVMGALCVPLLLALRAPDSLLGAQWVVSPVLGLFLHPVVGHISDLQGNRGPLSALMGILTALGFSALFLAQGLEGPAQATVTFGVFSAMGLIDVNLDLLLTLARAAMNDAHGPEESAQRCAIAGGIGRGLAFVCVAFMPADGVFRIAAVLMLCVALAQCLLEHSHPPAPQAEPELVSAPPVVGFMLVWALHFAFYVSDGVFEFFFTAVWAERAGAMKGSAEFEAAVSSAGQLLVWHAAALILFGTALPSIVAWCGGERCALILTNVLISSASFCIVWSQRNVASAAVVLAWPICSQLGSHVPFAWLEKQEGFDEGQRGYLIGRLERALSASQLLVGLGSGPLIGWAGGRLDVVFIVSALLVTAVTGAACLISDPWCGGRLSNEPST